MRENDRTTNIFVHDQYDKDRSLGGYHPGHHQGMPNGAVAD